MKTTIELPDELLAKAKTVAVERRTTLKAMIEHALKRELNEGVVRANECAWDANEFGFPVLKRVPSKQVTSERVYEMLEDEG